MAVKARKIDSNQPVRKRGAPARTIKGREDQLASLAVDLAEKQLIDGTASAQVIVHFLKLATERERLERVKLEQENKLLEAKTEQVRSSKDTERLYQDAIRAFSTYRTNASEEGTDDDFEG